MGKSYDKLARGSLNLLDLPFTEGAGTWASGVEKPRHRNTLVGVPAWTTLASGINTLLFDGITDYLECAAAATADLNFLAGDYSLACWVKMVNTGGALIVMGKYEINVSGWELFFFGTTLNLRHSHASLNPDLSDSCYSDGWPADTWCLIGLSRSGLYPVMYQNGVAQAMFYEASGMQNPDTAVASDLVIGVRYTKNANYYSGSMWRPRVINRALTEYEWRLLFNMERKWFGV